MFGHTTYASALLSCVLLEPGLQVTGVEETSFSCVFLHQPLYTFLWYLAPVIPGHEIVGRVLKVGPKVTEFQASIKSYIELLPRGRRR